MEPALEIGKRFNPYKLFTGAYIPNSLMESREFTSTEKLAWARLVQLSKGHDGVEATHAMIAVGIGIAEQSVPAVVKGLVKKKLIEKVLPTGQDRLDHRPVSYYFLWHPIFGAALRVDTVRGVGSDTDCGLSADTDSIQYQRIKKENSTENTPLPPKGGTASEQGTEQDSRVNAFIKTWNHWASQSYVTKLELRDPPTQMEATARKRLATLVKNKNFDVGSIQRLLPKATAIHRFRPTLVAFLGANKKGELIWERLLYGDGYVWNTDNAQKPDDLSGYWPDYDPMRKR